MRIPGTLLILPPLLASIWRVRSFPQLRQWAYVVLDALPCTISVGSLGVALINSDKWPGHARGLNASGPYGDLVAFERVLKAMLICAAQMVPTELAISVGGR